MPLLSHWPDREKPFRSQDSEVCKWFMEQEWFWEWCMTKARDAGAIIYDLESKKWVGTQTDLGQVIIEKLTVATVSIDKG
jgi:hypothetical protein